MKPRPRPCGPLLHNMSAPSQTVINHPGVNTGPYAQGLIFSMPPAEDHPSAALLLALLDGTGCELPDWEAEAELRRRINQRAQRLDLPPAAMVTVQRTAEDRECQDLLSILTVLSKSSDHVYLRDKEPNLASLRPGRRVVVTIPLSFLKINGPQSPDGKSEKP
jgi:hypothetical protein